MFESLSVQKFKTVCSTLFNFQIFKLFKPALHTNAAKQIVKSLANVSE
jgi:hypothetical protein